MEADRTRHDHGITRPYPVRPKFDTGSQHTDSCGGDVDAVSMTAIHHLGVTRDDRDARSPGRVAHRASDEIELGEGQSLLEHHADRQVERTCACHGDVVDRAVDGEVSDVASGEEPRSHDE